METILTDNCMIFYLSNQTVYTVAHTSNVQNAWHAFFLFPIINDRPYLREYGLKVAYCFVFCDLYLKL